MDPALAKFLWENRYPHPEEFVMAAYYHQFGKLIPAGALREDTALLFQEQRDRPLPNYLATFIREVLATSKTAK